MTPADELTAYFLSAESDQGMSSSWGPLVAIAESGDGGSPDPERRITNRRFAFNGPTAISVAGDVRRALVRLPQQQQCALLAAYGALPWSQIIDAHFGRGMGEKVAKKLGALAPVALLTEDLRLAWERAAAAEAKETTVRWSTMGAFVVALCIDARPGAAARLAPIATAARKLLAGAETAYLVARRGPAHEGWPAISRAVRAALGSKTSDSSVRNLADRAEDRLPVETKANGVRTLSAVDLAAWAPVELARLAQAFDTETRRALQVSQIAEQRGRFADLSCAAPA